jgi:hypothetical protein
MTPAEIKRNKVMRYLIWFNAAMGCIFVGVSIAAYWYPDRRVLPELPPSVEQRVAESQDIEALRKLALLYVNSDNKMAKTFNDVFSKGLDTFARILRMVGILFALNFLLILKYQRAAEGRPIRWLGWV